MTDVSLWGKKTMLSGALPAPGNHAPDFMLVDKDLQNRHLQDYSGKRKLIYTVPSLDTPVCAKTTRKLNELAKDLPSDTVILIISADLPFAQSRFCKNSMISHVILLSTMCSQDFATDYGVLISDGPLAGLNTRAMIVLDEQDHVLYSELVAEIGDEPDYESAFAALRS